MRFIVDLFRVIILAGVAVTLIGGSYLVFRVFLMEGGTAELNAAVILGAVAVAIMLILSLGMLATIISAHDRLAAMSDEMVRIADTLEANNGSNAAGESQ